MTRFDVAVIAVTFTPLAAALFVACRDDWRSVRRDRTIEEIIGRRYAQPTRLRVWRDDTFSVPTSTWNYGNSAGSDVGTDTTAHAASLEGAEVAHAGATSRGEGERPAPRDGADLPARTR